MIYYVNAKASRDGNGSKEMPFRRINDAARLRICAECEHRAVYTCRKCGCYVQVRAARKSYACPSEEQKWGEAEES